MSEQPPKRITRPLLDRDRPNRAAANFYRAAVDNPNAIGGLPLDSVESAVTAAVRLGYKVAEAQVDRTARFAKGLRDAGDRSVAPGRGRSDKQALDATEQLVFNALMAGLGWLEGVAADRHPLKRLASAQFQLLGSPLGLLPSDQPAADPTRPPESPLPDDTAVRSSSRNATLQRPPDTRAHPQIQHALTRGGPPVRRAVQVRHWQLATDARGNYPLTFYRETGAVSVSGELRVSRTGSTTLMMNTSAKTATGIYKAAICDQDGVQLGYVEIAL